MCAAVVQDAPASAVETRVCTACRQSLPTSAFYVKGRNKWTSRCKACLLAGKRRHPDTPPPNRGINPRGAELESRRDSLKTERIERRRGSEIAVPRPSVVQRGRRPWSDLSPAEASRRLRRYVAEGKPLRHFADNVLGDDLDESEN